MRLVCLILLLLGLSGAAFAVPVIGIVVAGLGGTAIFAISWGTIIFTGAMMLYGQSQQRKAKQEQQAQLARDKASYNANLRDREISGVAVEFPERFVYGTARLGVSVVAIFTSGGRDEYKHVVGVIAQHELDSIEEVYLDKVPVGPLHPVTKEATTGKFITTTAIQEPAITITTNSNRFPLTLSYTPMADSVSVLPIMPYYDYGNGTGAAPTEPNPGAFTGFKIVGNQIIDDPAYIGAPLNPLFDYELKYSRAYVTSFVRVSKNLGASDAVSDALLREAVGAVVWPPTAILRGHSYVYIRLLIDKPEFQGSLPQIEVLCRGKKVLDVRTGATAWSANPALCIRDYLTSKFGAVPSDDIPTSQFIAAANDCDEVVSMPGGEVLGPRYTLNGVVTSDESRETVLQNMATAMAGDIVETTWDVYAGKYSAPVMDLYQEDIVGEFAVSPGNPELAVFNTVKGSFVSAENKYIPTDYKPYTNEVYRYEDEEPLERDLNFAFTNTYQRVVNLCRILVEDNRNAFAVVGHFSRKAWHLKVGQRIRFTSAFFGQVAKVYRVTDKEFGPGMSVVLSLKEDGPTIWDMADSVVPDDTPNTNLNSPFVINAFANITLESGTEHLLISSSGSVQSRILAQWPLSTSGPVLANGTVDVEYQIVGDQYWQAALTVSGNDTQTYINNVQDDNFYFVRARQRNPYLNVVSPWTYSAPHLVVGKTAPPTDVGQPTYAFEKGAVRINWPSIADKDLGEYEIRSGGTTWESATYVARTKTTSFLVPVQNVAVNNVWVKAIDQSGNYSLHAAVVAVVLIVATATSVAAAIAGQNVVLSWQATEGSFAIDYFDIRVGLFEASAVSVSKSYTSTFSQKITHGGNQMYWVTPVDIAGNRGNTIGASLLVNNPKAVTIQSEVIDNNVLLRWNEATTTLPVDRYEIRKGAAYATGQQIGDNGNGRFATFFEQAAGTYTYWIVAYDTANNAATASKLDVQVSQPPDYVLRDNYFSTLNGTRSGVWLEQGKLYAPLFDETWQQHFASRGWATPQAQLNAGFTRYFQPSNTASFYEETIDYGAVLTTIAISMVATTQVTFGAVAVTPTLSVKKLIGDPWINYPGQSQVVAADFRYVKARLDFAASGGDDLIEVTALNVKLSSKLKNDAGEGTAAAADVGGTPVSFAIPFIDVTSIVVSPKGTTARFAIYDFVDTPYPTSFKVLLYDTSGNRVSGLFSWAAKGI